MTDTMIYILRHGETSWNARHLFQGQVDTTLDDNGRAQAAQAKKRIQSLGLSFDAVYSSPISRAVETVEIVTGLPREKIVLDDRLKEMNFGPLDGTPFDLHAPQVGHLFDDPVHYIPPEGAESYDQLENRLASFYTELAQKRPGRSILVGCHGCAIRLTMVWMGYLKLGGIWKQGIGNCALIEVRLDADNIFTVTNICNTQDFIAEEH